ncbi:hypothetical protein V490_09287 [Pseudogymnoascus sp. VKM F-3557]|nr:hypothetical protein V490_09287 [Pseudogymnoascus sp. VKM F-3557]
MINNTTSQRLECCKMLAEKPLAKPLLLIALAEVLPQWVADIEQMSDDFIYLRLSFMVLVTATVLLNSISDWASFAKLIASDCNPWTPDNYTQKQFTMDTNPFKLPNDHMAKEELILLTRAFKIWVLRKDVDPSVGGKRLKEI